MISGQNETIHTTHVRMGDNPFNKAAVIIVFTPQLTISPGSHERMGRRISSPATPSAHEGARSRNTGVHRSRRVGTKSTDIHHFHSHNPQPTSIRLRHH